MNLNKILANLRTAPEIFVRKLIKAEPDEWQATALGSFVTGKRLAIRSGHGVGKTAFLSWVVLFFLFCYPAAKVICTAPTARQLYDVLFSELAKWIKRSDFADAFDVQKTAIRLKSAPAEHFAIARTAAKPENLAGFHADNLLFIIDEASGVDDDIFEVVEGALTGTNNKLILCSNPTRSAGFFFRAFHQDRALYTTFKVSSLDSARVNTDYAERLIRTYGADSDVVRVRVLGEFPKAEADGLIALEWIETAVNREVIPDGKIIIGVDVARFGDDQSVMAVRIGNAIVGIKKWTHADLMTTCGRIAQEARKYKKALINIDAGGMGAGVVDRLRELNFTVYGIDFGGKAARKDCANKAAEMYLNLRDCLQAGEISLPSDDNLAAELSTRKYTLDSAGKFVLEKKSAFKKRIGRSPDTADAVALAFANSISAQAPSFLTSQSYWR